MGHRWAGEIPRGKNTSKWLKSRQLRYTLSMTKNIQNIIEKEIPIVKSMGVEFVEFTDLSCLISVPIGPNHNHKGTVFGGSLYSACTSACYGLMYSMQIIKDLNEYDLVIGEGTIRYQKPVHNDFHVRSQVKIEDQENFLIKLKKNGFSKINLTAHVFIQDEATHLCEYSATFIMMKKT